MYTYRFAPEPVLFVHSHTLPSPEESYHELAYYTLNHEDRSFIHQHVVDAFAAQNASFETKPITLIFALVGLYQYIEKGFSGRQVQQFHMLMAEHKQAWPPISIPPDKGQITVADALATVPGNERDKMIRKWCESVWKAYSASHAVIRHLEASYTGG